LRALRILWAIPAGAPMPLAGLTKPGRLRVRGQTNGSTTLSFSLHFTAMAIWLQFSCGQDVMFCIPPGTTRLNREGGCGAWATHSLWLSSLLPSALLAQDSMALPFFLTKDLRRWASGDGGRCKMVLEAASHGPARRRSGLDGRSAVNMRQGQGSAAILATEQPFSGTALLPPEGEGSRKGDLKKACLSSSCQRTVAVWTSNTAVENRDNMHQSTNKRRQCSVLEPGTSEP